MAKTGFRFDVKKLRSKLGGLANLRADEFYDDVMEYTRKSLNSVQALTPTRDYSTIRANQIKQYDYYVNYIPDSHKLTDPSLRIKGRQHWLYFRGKWLNASDWRLSSDAYAAYQKLLSEHQRRKQTTQASFVKGRAQARFLYRKTWSEAAASLGLQISTSANVRASTSRRKPPVAPPKSYGQTHGGGTAFSVTVSTPFLTQSPRSRYQTFEASEIMGSAQAKHLGEFQRSIKRRLRALAKQ